MLALKIIHKKRKKVMSEDTLYLHNMYTLTPYTQPVSADLRHSSFYLELRLGECIIQPTTLINQHYVCLLSG